MSKKTIPHQEVGDGMAKGSADPPRTEQQEEAPTPARERRSTHRVTDDQKSGQGSLSALSKMRMIERRRAVVSPKQ